MRSDRALFVVVFAFVTGCSSTPPPRPVDTSLWTPPGQGDLEVADNHREPVAKPKPRARHVLAPNRADRNAKLR